MKPPLADVGVRARGLGAHLLSEDTLRRLARSSGSGVLAGALQAAGYWPAPTERGRPLSTVETIDAAVEHELTRRLAVLARWLGDRRPLFAGVFEYEERRAIRFWLRGVFSGDDGRPAPRPAPGAWALPRRQREELAGATDAADLVRAMQRAHSPYAPALASALHPRGAELAALETALDRAFAARALAGAAHLGGRLLDWVREGIDLENAWDALAGGAVFVAGGRQLSRDQHAAVAREPNEAARRGRLSRCFATSPLAGVFDEPDLATAALESRARSVRIRRERHAVRIDPLGPGPILELVMRLRAERAELRRINWGIAQGRPAEAIIGQMPRRQ